MLRTKGGHKEDRSDKKMRGSPQNNTETWM